MSNDFQPESFSFTEESTKEIGKILAKYPAERKASAVMPLLTLAQKQNNNWIPRVAMAEIAKILSIPETRVLEVATFYTMYNLEPVGKHHVQVCTNLACWLKGSDKIVEKFEKELGISMGQTSSDNEFTLSYVECAGACTNAPVVQIGVDYYEDLTPEAVSIIVGELKAGKTPKVGPYSDRKCSEPAGGLTTLTEGGDA
ncbi:MAG: NADH-quinone oxidoreductase subunit NuoE [Alphaproteobacteria bacterium]